MASASNNPSFIIPNITSLVSVKLEGPNYLNGTTQFIPVLRSHDLLSIVDGSEVCPAQYLVDSDGKVTSDINPSYLVCKSWADQLSAAGKSDWLADTIHLVHAVSSVNNEIVYEASQGLMQKLALEAVEVAMVMTEARIVQGEAGKVICKEAERIKPAAVVMGTRGRSLMQSVLQGSVSEYCFHNCKSAPVVIVPGKEAGDESLI
ncbi:hypothetical protein Pint_34673 [Pistacia integerrima]|uniref:Uncharacterized protein n=1 Tax=Pistacia integerrima TaxID=434235 RepID=A0ACC0X6K0_9ROSI|nr:hypothetical protein Pint_34673 [Pistacia integerrima]